jgi:two-component system LytT family response regulator
MTWSAIIIDDERLARLALRKDLERLPEISLVGEASGISSAKDLIGRVHPDLLFLDVQLADGNGFDLLNQIDFEGRVIFITAYDEYAIRAFEINAVDYLLKPVSRKRLKSAITKLQENDKSVLHEVPARLEYNDRLMVMHRKSVNFIKIDTIRSIHASREYSYIRAADGREYLTSKSITEWENKLPDQNFCRIHRSTIVNFDQIMKVNHNITGTGEVILQGSTEPLAISRNYFRKLKQRYGA